MVTCFKNRVRHASLKLSRYIALATILTLPATGIADDAAPVLRDAGPGQNIRLAGDEFSDARRVFIVQLDAPSAAEEFAKLASKSARGSGAAGSLKPRPRFDRNSALVSGYAAKLEAAQDRVLTKAGPGARKIYSYVYGLNGFAAEMTPGQAHKLENLPEVLNVWEDEILSLIHI